MTGWIRRWYGASPLHLLALLAAFGLAGYAVHAVLAAGQWTGFAEWFAVAIIGHDLLLFPLYSLADLSLQRLLPGWASRRRPRPGGPGAAPPPGTAQGAAPPPGTAPPPGGERPPVSGPRQASGPSPGSGPPQVPGPSPLNYIRVPVLFSLLLLMAFFPLILGLSHGAYHAASGLGTQPYLWRWLGLTGVMFAISATAYAWRTRRAQASYRRAVGGRRPPTATAQRPPPASTAPATAMPATAMPATAAPATAAPATTAPAASRAPMAQAAPAAGAAAPPEFDVFMPRRVDPGPARSPGQPGRSA